MQEKNSDQDFTAYCKAKYMALRQLGMRSILLFINFFLIIMALYQLKPASRSLFIDSLGSQRLPYVWIITAIVMGVIITYYHKIVQLYSRINIVLGTCLIFSAALVLFRLVFFSAIHAFFRRCRQNQRPGIILFNQPGLQRTALHPGGFHPDISGQSLDRHVRLSIVQSCGVHPDFTVYPVAALQRKYSPTQLVHLRYLFDLDRFDRDAAPGVSCCM